MSVNDVMYGLSYLSPLVLLAGSAVGAITYKRSPAIGRWIFFYMLFSLLLDIVARYWAFIAPARNNLFLLSVNGLIDLIFFSYLYTRFFRLNYAVPVRIASIVIGVVVTIAIILRGTESEGIADFQAYEKVLCDGAIFLFALISMFDLLRGKRELRQEIVRINAIVLLYASLNMLMSLIMNFLVNAGQKNIIIYFWILRLGLVIALYLILIFTLWQAGKNRKHWQYG